MNYKKIANIVFYKVSNGNVETKQATIFYQDGTVRTVNFEQGIDACEEIVKERHIQTKDAFKEMINHDIVHVISAKEFKENFSKYVPSKIIPAEEEALHNEEVVETPAERVSTPKTSEEASAEEEEEKEEVVTDDEDEDVAAIDDEEVEEDHKSSVAPVAVGAATAAATSKGAAKSTNSSKTTVAKSNDAKEESDPNVYHFTEEEEEALNNGTYPSETSSESHTDDHKVAFDSSIEDRRSVQPQKEEKEGFFKRTWRKIKENRLIKKVLLCVTALAVAFGIYSCSQRKTLEGTMNRSNLPAATTLDNTNNADNSTYYSDDVIELSDEALHINEVNPVDAHFYNNATLKALFDRTTNDTQKTAMINVGAAMDAFNNRFASYYLEEGKDVRPALKFDEVVALGAAYNDYSKEQLQAVFNGADIRSADLSRSYKDANLQLMGAYAIENSEHPVDMSSLLLTQEGKEFYQRYHNAFLAAKEATGDEKLRLVSDFYQMVRDDFPITNDVRTEGISHSHNYDSIESYKLSVTPMIAAAEMMWQNLPTDITLNDSEIDFINDLGLCNYADKTFERAELITLTHDADPKNPTYQEYKAAFVGYYQGLGTYYVDDAHRELTELQSFQDAVNWHFDPQGEWEFQGQTWTETETHQEEVHWEETTTTYHEETETRPVDESEVPEETREKLKEKVDKEIEKENERRKKEAEKKAEKERQRLQAEADTEAARIEEEVRQDEEDLQQHIEDANEQIDHNHEDQNPQNDQPVNEADLGHGVDFDDDHSDEHGNLDSSVEHITTDPTGDMTDQPLPDPNQTGAAFDAAAEQNNSNPPAGNTNDDNGSVESVPVPDDYYYEDSWIEYDDAVAGYVDYLADQMFVEDVDSYQYTR
ncbi:MAG: hypothetical protein J6X28_03380 [Bacilli bacterium]|nr:hypothetical protein [Bacilli bacterium]